MLLEAVVGYRVDGLRLVLQWVLGGIMFPY